MKPREISVAAGEVRLSALEYGPPDGAPLVLVHGIRDLAWSFDPVARAFAGQFRVLVPHLRGHGDSDKPGAYAMADLVGDLRALVDGLALEHPVLVGHSLGGQIVAGYAGVFRDVPRALVVIEGMGPPEREAERSEEGRLARLRRGIRSLDQPPTPPAPLPDLEAALERSAAATRSSIPRVRACWWSAGRSGTRMGAFVGSGCPRCSASLRRRRARRTTSAGPPSPARCWS